MKILVVGNGGREHAICRALASATPKPEILIAPGNAGTSQFAKNMAVSSSNITGLKDLASREQVDLVIPGPEVTLVAGLSDALLENKIPCAGPLAAAATLEGSKAFVRTLAKEANVPSPKFCIAKTRTELESALDDFSTIPVIKADGLASGKGVFLADARSKFLEIGQNLLNGQLGASGKTLVLEERLVGTEASLFFACSGTNMVLLPHAQDHKRLRDGNTGPNTGGMGAICPNPNIDASMVDRVADEIVAPTLHALAGKGVMFKGFLFAGLMLSSEGPKLLEYNVRLGDPEAQAILPCLKPGAFLDLCVQLAHQDLKEDGAAYEDESLATCAVVLAAEGYPNAPKLGEIMKIDRGLETADRWLDHAGTTDSDDGVKTSGGRVAAVVARAQHAEEARKCAYGGAAMVHFESKFFRKDIGAFA